MRSLRLSEFVQPPAVCHYATPLLGQPRPLEMHDHNFIEVFWIESGRGWHWINEHRRRLSPGMMCFIRAADRHGFSAITGKSLRLVNIAFARRTWNTLRRRYELSDPFDPVKSEPMELQLNDAQLIAARLATEELQAGRCDRLATDRFLLNLHRLIEPQNLVAAHAGEPLPDWLRQVLEVLNSDPDANPPLSTREMADLAGRTPEHLARTIRRCLGKTPTDVLNGAKLSRAAARLAHSADAIVDIALDCGFENLSHFYKLFSARYRLTPRRYRLQQQRILGSGGAKERLDLTGD